VLIDLLFPGKAGSPKMSVVCRPSVDRFSQIECFNNRGDLPPNLKKLLDEGKVDGRGAVGDGERVYDGPYRTGNDLYHVLCRS